LELSLVQAYHPAEVVGDPLTILNLTRNSLVPVESESKQADPRALIGVPQRTDSITQVLPPRLTETKYYHYINICLFFITDQFKARHG